jgi:tetratricopeptide (TPR) repeat protein
MGKNQVIALAIAIGTVMLFYLGCDNLSQSQQKINETRKGSLVATDIQNLLNNAKDAMSETNKGEISVLESMVRSSKDDTLTMLSNLEKLSATWFQFGHAEIAGHYAKEIANMKQDAGSWEIAGTTFVLCLQNNDDKKIRQFCSTNAVSSFENAISEDPDNVSHRINLALCYVEEPQKDNPMRGILMLRELTEKYPDNPSVQYQLGRLAVMTGQFEKAIERLEKAYTLNPDDRRIVCLLADTYQKTGDLTKSEEFAKKCTN